jgi:transposase-like protein
MKKRQWTGQQKLQIILEGFRDDKRVSELCNMHEIAQSQYYKWRDQFLKKGASIFDEHPDKKAERLKSENRRLKHVIGELTVELKKTEDELKWLES